ncbi:MAG: hypothetical protein QHC90_26110 [Shinella sp.]|nr:hypothetical protein [Shinella sp.]
MTEMKDTAPAQAATPAGVMITVQTQLREQQVECDWHRRRLLMLSQINADLMTLNEQLSAELAAAHRQIEEMEDEFMSRAESPETREDADGAAE